MRTAPRSTGPDLVDRPLERLNREVRRHTEVGSSSSGRQCVFGLGQILSRLGALHHAPSTSPSRKRPATPTSGSSGFLLLSSAGCE